MHDCVNSVLLLLLAMVKLKFLCVTGHIWIKDHWLKGLVFKELGSQVWWDPGVWKVKILYAVSSCQHLHNLRFCIVKNDCFYLLVLANKKKIMTLTDILFHLMCYWFCIHNQGLANEGYCGMWSLSNKDLSEWNSYFSCRLTHVITLKTFKSRG